MSVVTFFCILANNPVSSAAASAFWSPVGSDSDDGVEDAALAVVDAAAEVDAAELVAVGVFTALEVDTESEGAADDP